MSSGLELDYKRLLARNREVVVLGSVEALVSWDMETMMPPRAVELRSEQLALLSQISHKLSTSPKTGKLLEDILKNSSYENLGAVEKRNVELIKKNYNEQTALPSELVAKLAKQQALTINVWKKAKAAKDFALFKPELEKLVELSKQGAQILKEVKQTKTAYDALIDIYEPKTQATTINQVFEKLQRELKKLISQIQSAPKQPNPESLKHKVPTQNQKQIAQLFMQTLGYDTTSPASAGRLDETEHPFTTGYYDDVRITTHYYEDKFASSIFSTLHEAGHALYEQGLPQQWKYQPVGAACSMGFHESQSRFYENIIGRSKPFWTFMFPKLKQKAPSLANAGLEEFVHAVNAVAPSKIRIEADEVTYNLHVIIRFQIEQDLFSDKVDVAELPQVWNQKYKDLLGVEVQNDAEGVMQDTHWASGLYGYFPTYALGNIYSGQILGALQKQVPDWESSVEKGDLKPVSSWLKSNVYSYANLYDPTDLIQKIVQTPISVERYMGYLQEKFCSLYGC
ncbi:MAG: carboxypeptidase M32 [Candidatus Bathyarchaeota archaeon]|nr:carboxypeptidase M32 [Candidatus Bathyarchaeota archaeon]